MNLTLRIPRARLAASLLACLALTGCWGGGDGTANIAYIGQPEDMFSTGLRLSGAGQQVRSATSEGLVALDEHGEIVPALAERWIVTDDGLSYIFRLRDISLPGGKPMTAKTVRDALLRSRRQLAGTSLALDLAKVTDIRAMTGRVIEVRLASPMPDLLQVLAQPEMGLRIDGKGTGPMALRRDGNVAVLTPIPPERRGLPEEPDWADRTREVHLRALGPKAAVAAFNAGEVDTVLGGTIANLPLADAGPLSRGTLRLDAVLGLFGLRVTTNQGFLETSANREALAMAIDRDALVKPFNIGGWVPTTRIVPANMPEESETIGERWSDLSMDQRIAIASGRVADWQRARGQQVTLRVGLPSGPGSDLLYARLAADFKAIGVTLRKAGMGEGAELELVDRPARFAGPRWFLNQLNCSVGMVICSRIADGKVAQAVATNDPAERKALLAEAETELTLLNGYIPFGAPIRWSMVRGDVTGFADNRWAIHPLYPFAVDPIS
ncbi:MAG: peptide ABC transporter substrate-binding protein [Sphingomonadales bacterium]|nr:peptide ABC transporter substrate-binding protein [Sphingomonadales bacterium]MBD3773751.1 peptide ABC transporter substrate-binding protein [Paracoccaceae bacterium]